MQSTDDAVIDQSCLDFIYTLISFLSTFHTPSNLSPLLHVPLPYPLPLLPVAPLSLLLLVFQSLLAEHASAKLPCLHQLRCNG